MSHSPILPLLLKTQEQFEELYTPSNPSSVVYPIVIQFSATWCGPCKKIDTQFLIEEFSKVTFYKCDVDENKYTPGFCGVRSIPSFLILKGPKQIVGPVQISDTAKIATWILLNTK